MFFNRYYMQNQEEMELLKLISSKPSAYAKISGGEKYKNLSGKISFYKLQNGVVVFANIKGLPIENEKCSPNIFAMHIHEGNDCSGDSEDEFKDAKTHLNPDNCPHPAHIGDLEPLFAGKNGKAIYAYWTDRFTISQIIGKVVIILSHVDDFTSQPSGNSGTKIACGKIEIN